MHFLEHLNSGNIIYKKGIVLVGVWWVHGCFPFKVSSILWRTNKAVNAGKAGGLWLQITNSNDGLPVRETTFPASGGPCHPLYGNRHEKYADVTSYEHVLRYVIITLFIVIDSLVRQRFFSVASDMCRAWEKSEMLTGLWSKNLKLGVDERVVLTRI